MIKIVYLISMFICWCSSMNGQTSNNVLAVFSMKFDVHDAYSILRLFDDNRFKYSWGVGGCQTEVTGKWEVRDGAVLKFTMDSIYTDRYLNGIEAKSLREAELIFQMDQDKSNYKYNIEMAKIRPCFPILKEALIDKRRKRVIFENEIKCACIPMMGEHRRVKYKKLKYSRRPF